jgi:hypothetical protein
MSLFYIILFIIVKNKFTNVSIIGSFIVLVFFSTSTPDSKSIVPEIVDLFEVSLVSISKSWYVIWLLSYDWL